MEGIDKQRVDELMNEWSGFNPETVYSVIDTDKPLVTIVMLSYRRRDRLLECLKHIPNTFKMPLNICLRVQGRMDDPEVANILDTYHGYDVMFTPSNVGTGVPRHERLHTALDTYDTPFIMFTDDDMKMPLYSIELLTSILIDNPEYGAVNMFTKPRSNVWKVIDGKLNPYSPSDVFDNENASALGSATLVVRREVFEECDLDSKYQVGLMDVDFGMQLYEKGWKMGMLNIDGYNASNLKGGDKTYMQGRHNVEWKKKSLERFRKKWAKYL